MIFAGPRFGQLRRVVQVVSPTFFIRRAEIEYHPVGCLGTNQSATLESIISSIPFRLLTRQTDIADQPRRLSHENVPILAPWRLLIVDIRRRNEAYGWHFQYLTVIGLALATMTFFVGLLADLTLSRHVFLVKNALSFCSAPLEVLVALLYWGLRVVCSTRSPYPAFLVPLSCCKVTSATMANHGACAQ